MQDSGGLTRKQERAVLALLTHPTVEAAAEAAGCNPVTLWRWLQQPAFQARYRTLRRQVVEQAIAEVQRAATEAVQTLARNLTCGQPSTEVRAAQIILEHALRGVEFVDFEERLAALEASVRAAERSGRLAVWPRDAVVPAAADR